MRHSLVVSQQQRFDGGIYVCYLIVFSGKCFYCGDGVELHNRREFNLVTDLSFQKVNT